MLQFILPWGSYSFFSFPIVLLFFVGSVGSVYYALLTHIFFYLLISNFILSLLMHIFIIAFKFNSSKVSSFYVFHQVFQVSHTRSLRLWQYCRHEPPVVSWDVSILQKEPEVLTVCKPASVPVSQHTDSQGLMQFPYLRKYYCLDSFHFKCVLLVLCHAFQFANEAL